MKIVVNALSARRGGGQVYLQHLLEKFPEDSLCELILLAPSSLPAPQGRSNIKFWSVSESLVNNPILRTLWEFFVLPVKLSLMDARVLFCPGGLVNGFIPAKCRVVTTFQNMMPFSIKQRKKYPLGYMRIRNWLLEKKLLRSMIRSDLVIFISNYAANFINEKSGGRIRNSVTIPHGMDIEFQRGNKPLPERPTWLPSEYILYVSILDVYKAQLEVVEAYAILKKRFPEAPPLVFVGAEYKPYADRVRQLITKKNLQNDILIKSAIPYKDLPSVYQNSILNIFASEVENCPFILLESMAAARPLLVSSYPPMPEFAGDAVEYFDPMVPEELAQKIECLLKNEILRAELAQKASHQSMNFDWNTTATRTWSEILRLAKS